MVEPLCLFHPTELLFCRDCSGNSFYNIHLRHFATPQLAFCLWRSLSRAVAISLFLHAENRAATRQLSTVNICPISSTDNFQNNFYLFFGKNRRTVFTVRKSNNFF